jgi:alkylhydroperoxidase family enzyme
MSREARAPMGERGPGGNRPTSLRLEPVDVDGRMLPESIASAVFDEAGRPLMIFRVLAHHELLLRRFNSLGALMRNSEVTRLRDREVIILRTARRSDCPFEFDQHLTIARAAGVPEDVLDAVEGKAVAKQGSSDALLLHMADEMFDDGCISDQTWARAAEIWTPPQLLELTVTAGYFRMAAILINSIGLRPAGPS